MMSAGGRGARTGPAVVASGPPFELRAAKKVPDMRTIHDDTLQDEYSWLRERENPEVRRFLEAENASTDAFMKPTEPFQKMLYDEMLSRIQETDLSVPYREGDWHYYSRTEKGLQYPIYCRRKGSLDAPEEVYLDVNELARGERFMNVGNREVSDDGRILAYTFDNTGFRDYTLRLRDLATGKTLPDEVARVSSVAWAGDNRTLFYTTTDVAKRPFRVYRHRSGTDPSSDVLLYEEKDERFRVFVSRSRSREIVFAGSASHTTSEWRWVPAGRPEAPLRVIAPREPDHEYDVDHRGDLFYIRTNRGCRNFRVVTAPVADPDPARWKEMAPCREGVMVEGIDLFAEWAVFYEREDAVPQIRVTRLATGASYRIVFPEAIYAVSPDANEVFETNVLRFDYESFTTPRSVFDFDMATRERTLLKQYAVLGGYDATRYESERRSAVASDGTRIPISLVYRKGFVPDGTAPMLLTAYGSYGAPWDAEFNSNRVSLLDRGVVFAVAHVRGGGELGKAWHDGGRMMSKKNTFTDFITVAETLIADRYASKGRLVIEGVSAGGLLVGAVTNMRPDLFHAVLARVPFLDVVNTMLDESLPLTIGEFEEWGNPKIRAEHDYIKSYSPYDNLTARDYPAMLVKTSFDDSQVMYWEPARYVARLRALKTDKNPLLLRVNMAGGHGGSSGRYDRLKEIAFDYAFILTEMGITA
jgi:oligopeptidase B